MLNPVYYTQKLNTGTRYNFHSDEVARLEHKGAVYYFTFPTLSALSGVRHCFSTRIGGVSTGGCSAMNLADNCGDSQENLWENYKRIADILEISPENIVLSDQVHGFEVARVDQSHRMGKNMTKRLQKTDGIITGEKKIALATSYADCVPLIFADEKTGVVASVHAGWRGTVACIGKKTVEKMILEFHCLKEDIHVVIGPSICQKCYEVSFEVAEAFLTMTQEVGSECGLKDEEIDWWKKEIVEDTKEKPEKYQLDLWMANRFILQCAGVPKENIMVSCVCTCCNSWLLHSHRATKGSRGGMRALIMNV